MTPRGIRNNNPLNIERKTTTWVGMAVDQSTDDRFIVFTDAVYGIRAGAKILHNYQLLHDAHTVGEMIALWAPSVENNTSAYAADVAQHMGVAPDQHVVLTIDNLCDMIAAMIRHENGVQPYTRETIYRGVRMAFS